GNSITWAPVVDAQVNPSVIAISPMGSSAAIYNPLSGSVQVIGHLPDAPKVIREFDASGGQGHAVHIALSDDGAIALIRFGDGEAEGKAELWLVEAFGSWRLVEGATAAAFLPKSHDAIIADDSIQSAFLMMAIDQSPVRVPVLSAADGLESFSIVSVS